MSKCIINKRVWLNPESTAFIYTKVKSNSSCWGTLKLADCSRIVEFDIELDGKKERKVTIRKLNIMINEITALRDAIEGMSDV